MSGKRVHLAFGVHYRPGTPAQLWQGHPACGVHGDTTVTDDLSKVDCKKCAGLHYLLHYLDFKSIEVCSTGWTWEEWIKRKEPSPIDPAPKP